MSRVKDTVQAQVSLALRILGRSSKVVLDDLVMDGEEAVRPVAAVSPGRGGYATLKFIHSSRQVDDVSRRGLNARKLSYYPINSTTTPATSVLRASCCNSWVKIWTSWASEEYGWRRGTGREFRDAPREADQEEG